MGRNILKRGLRRYVNHTYPNRRVETHRKLLKEGSSYASTGQSISAILFNCYFRFNWFRLIRPPWSCSRLTKHPMQRPSMSSEYDPFEVVLQPPVDETPSQREARLAAEQEALLVSQQIDEFLKADRAVMKKRRSQEVKVLIIGQEGSGKTTTLKQFLLNFSSTVFSGERAGWRAVIFLNVISSLKIILQNLSAEFDGEDGSGPSQNISSPMFDIHGQVSSFAEIKLRLAPLLHMENSLIRKLRLGSPDDSERIIRSWPISAEDEVSVHSGISWKRAFERHRHSSDNGETRDSMDQIDWSDRGDPGVLFHASRNELTTLWSNPRVQEVLRRRRVNLEDSGFFLDDLDTITGKQYMPTDAHILRARLKTTGASEHVFSIKTGPEKGMDWKLYDVGGARTQRQTWAPFFDDVDAILFLAPISAFDQNLSEDRRINRLEDSMMLWTELCKNEILKRVPLILFLNKCDLLKLKLDSGVPVRKYVTSYGDRQNDFAHVSTYFRNKFEAVKRHHSPPNREVFIHLTSMTDLQGSAAVIASEDPPQDDKYDLNIPD